MITKFAQPIIKRRRKWSLHLSGCGVRTRRIWPRLFRFAGRSTLDFAFGGTKSCVHEAPSTCPDTFFCGVVLLSTVTLPVELYPFFK
jgi:hypothetical protein